MLKWLYPGMGVKRWILVCMVGVFLISGGAAGLTGIGLLARVERRAVDFIRQLTTAIPEELLNWAAAALIVVGVVATVWGVRKLVQSLIAVAAPEAAPRLADVVFEQRQLKRGPRVVAIGGGTGLSTLLRGLKEYTSNITAIVAVSDDGGSSGRLRAELGMPPPGDIRNTLVALADTEPLMERLFNHRFDAGEGLAGHSFGNLLLAAMTEVTGDFEEAIRASSRVLAIRGQVLPGTLQDVRLGAIYEDGTRIVSESAIPKSGKRIRRVFLRPANVRPTREALKAVVEADLIVIGPGSLFTSVLPNLLIGELAAAIRNSSARKVYVCNVMTQPGETDGFDVADHVRAIVDHVGPHLFQYVLANTSPVGERQARRYRSEGAEPVRYDPQALREMGFTPVGRPLMGGEDLVRHDARLLAEAILDLAGDAVQAVRPRAVGRSAAGPAVGSHG